MEYQPLGKSGFSVSRIGFGCMSLGADPVASTRLLHAAIDKGINFFDTADLYDKGQNEETLGRALKTKRKDVLIATKVGNEWKQDGSGWTWNPRKAYIVSAIEKSLLRLQTDYIDLYQLHGGTIEDDIDETIGTFNQMQQQGKIRSYGISSIRPNVIRAYAYRSAACSVMMQYSLLDRRPEEFCLDLLYDKQVAILARGSLASGLLVDKPAKNYLGYTTDEVKKAADAIATVSANIRNRSSTALKFVLQHPAIVSAIVGIRTIEHLTEAVSSLEAPALTQQELSLLEQSIPKNYYKEHR